MTRGLAKTWDCVPLRDICEQINYGYTASAKQEPIGPKFLRITDIVDELINWESVPYCTISEKEFAKYELQRGDIVIARTGATSGYAKMIKKHPKAVFASYLVRLRIKEEHDWRYVGLIAESDDFKRYIKSVIGGAAQPQANAQVLTSFLIPLPPLPIQRKIAAILSAYDDLIENNTRRIRILEEMAQFIYREWFINFRFPDHETIRMVDSKLGKIPEGWEIGKLKDIVKEVKQSTYPGEHLSNRRYVPIDCISKKSIALIDSRPWQEAQSSLFLFSKDDILFGAMRPYFHKVAVAPYDGVTRSTCLVLRPVDDSIYGYAVYLLFQDATVGYATAHSQGTTIPYTAWNGSLEDMDIVIPDKILLKRFNAIVSANLALVHNLVAKNGVLRQSRDLLLPHLISDELDVSELDIDTNDSGGK